MTQKFMKTLKITGPLWQKPFKPFLRRENYPQPYEALKDLTRGNNKIDKKAIHQFIDGLKVDSEIKKELKKITPHNYTGTYS